MTTPRIVNPFVTAGAVKPRIDLEAMVGPFESIPCESPTHDSDKNIHDDGPGAMYLQIWHECFAVVGSIKVSCAKHAAWFAAHGERPLVCIVCHRAVLVKDLATVVGPIGSFTKEAK